MILKNMVGRTVTKPIVLPCGTVDEIAMLRRKPMLFNLKVGDEIRANGIKMTIVAISRHVYVAEYAVKGKTIRESFRIDDYGRAYDLAKVKAVRRES